MMALQVIPGEGSGRRTGRHTRLAAQLAVAWEASVADGYRLVALASTLPDPRVRARVLVLAAFCRAHATRLVDRLSAMGQGPLPVPPDERPRPAPGLAGLREALAKALVRVVQYRDMAETALKAGDVRTHWICHASRAEREDEVRDLAELVAALGKGTGT